MLNQKEREVLANIAVQAKYGAAANSYSASISDAIVKAFPSLSNDFHLHANVVSSERVVAGIISVIFRHIGEHVDPNTKQRSELLACKEEIAEALYDWCESAGVSADSLVDANVDCKQLIQVQSLKDFMTSYSNTSKAVELFASQLPGGNVDLLSLIS
jgi:hypothetical protein